jgi:hypothetical protein
MIAKMDRVIIYKDCYAGITAGSKVIHLTDKKTDEEITSNNNYLVSFSDIEAAKETIDKFYLD